MPEACYLPSYDGWIFGKIWGFTTETFSHVLAKFIEILSLHAGLNHATVWSDRNDQILFDCFSRDSQLLGSQVSSTLMATEWSSIALSVALLKNKHQRTYCTKSLNSWITTLHCSIVENVSFFFPYLTASDISKMRCIGASSGHSVRRDEFIEFAQFLTVMNFLTNTEEGQSVGDLRFDSLGEFYGNL